MFQAMFMMEYYIGICQDEPRFGNMKGFDGILGTTAVQEPTGLLGPVKINLYM